MTARQVLSFKDARARKASNPQARWPSVAAEFTGEVWPEIRPSFRVAPGETVFTIGSCFARNIERHLAALGCRVPMLEFRLPPDEWHGEPNGAMNKFHPPAFRQCMAWTAKVFDRDGVVTWDDCAPLAFDLGDGRFIDLDMGANAPVSRARFLERRQHIHDIFKEAFSAGCLMMTPGLIEAWRDRTTGLYLHEAPTHKAMLAAPERWELEILAYEDCLAAMLDVIDVVRVRNPHVRVLITTSPVPMTATFSGQDVRVANAYSKSVLRAVCGAATAQRPLVDYFPSYESVTLSFPMGVWSEDRIHVASGFVGKIVTRMLDCYLEGVADAARAFQKARTAIFNKEFAEAEAAARAVLVERPDHAEARRILAEALLRQYRLDEAEAELRPLLQTQPDRPDIYFALARALSRNKARAHEAIALVEKGAVLPGVTLTDIRGVAALVRTRAAPETAEGLARRAVELFPLHVEAHHFLAEVLADQGRTAEAAEVMWRATGLRRTRAQDFVRLAELEWALGRAKPAAKALRGALVLEPDHAGALALQASIDAGQPLEGVGS